jgi:CHAT domain-containing protein
MKSFPLIERSRGGNSAGVVYNANVTSRGALSGVRMESRRYYPRCSRQLRQFVLFALVFAGALPAGAVAAPLVQASAPPASQPPAAAATQAPAPLDCEPLKRGPLPQWPDSAETSKRLADCGYALTHEGDYARAQVIFLAALDMARRRSDAFAEAMALDGYGITLGTLGQTDKAETALQQSYDISERIGDKDGMAEACSQLGHLRNIQARYDEAREFHMRSFTLWEAMGSEHGMAVALNNVGAMYRAIGDYATASEYYQRSLDGLQRMGDRRRSATVIDNLARNARVLGDYAKGLELSQQALAIRESFNDREGISRSLTSLSESYRAQGNYTAALDSLQRSLALSTAIGNVHAIAETLNNIAVVYEAQGNYTQAVEYLRKSLALNDAKVHSASLSAEVQTHLGAVYFRQGLRVRAVQSLERSLAISQASALTLQGADARLALARVLTTMGQVTRPAQLLREVLAFHETTRDPSGRAEALIAMADVERRRGRPADSLALAGEARDLAGTMELVDVQWAALLAIGRAEVALKRTAAARDAFDAAIAIVEDMRAQNAGGQEVRSRFFADRLAPYEERIALALAASDAAQAFAVAERSKARALLDVIKSDRVPITKAMSADERRHEAELRTALSSVNSEVQVAAGAATRDEARIAALKRKREARRRDYEDFQAHLYAVHAQLQVNRASVPVIGAAEAQRLLPAPATAIVEFVTGRDRTHAFVISTSAVRAFELPLTTAELTRRVERFRGELASRDLRASESARALYDAVLGPMRELLRGKTDLIIVPDGILWNLPFQALQPAANHYLIEDAALSYAPSVTVLREAMRRRAEPQPSQPTVLAFGHSTGVEETRASTGAPPAAGSARRESQIDKEATEIAGIYQASSHVYTAAEAQEGRWKSEAPGYRVVHLATHGVLDNASPLYSHLVLAPPAAGDKDDGLLEAWEIMNMQLSADLVVLSACETARGAVAPGEGIIGLMWSVFVAGTPATLVSQWQVDSESSTRLMVGFHEAWRGGQRGVSKSRALQQAALGVMKTPGFAHPFYWAGFILAGDGR